jgi:hypothetical protein
MTILSHDVEDIAYTVDMHGMAEVSGGCSICSVYASLVYVDTHVLAELGEHGYAEQWHAMGIDGWYMLSIDHDKSIVHLKDSTMIERAHGYIDALNCNC